MRLAIIYAFLGYLVTLLLGVSLFHVPALRVLGALCFANLWGLLTLWYFAKANPTHALKRLVFPSPGRTWLAWGVTYFGALAVFMVHAMGFSWIAALVLAIPLVASNGVSLVIYGIIQDVIHS